MLAALLDAPTAPVSVLGGGDRRGVVLVGAVRAIADDYLALHGVRRDWTFSTYAVDHGGDDPRAPEMIFLPGRPDAQPGPRTVVDLGSPSSSSVAATELAGLLVERREAGVEVDPAALPALSALSPARPRAAHRVVEPAGGAPERTFRPPLPPPAAANSGPATPRRRILLVAAAAFAAGALVATGVNGALGETPRGAATGPATGTPTAAATAGGTGGATGTPTPGAGSGAAAAAGASPGGGTGAGPGAPPGALTGSANGRPAGAPLVLGGPLPAQRVGASVLQLAKLPNGGYRVVSVCQPPPDPKTWSCTVLAETVGEVVIATRSGPAPAVNAPIAVAPVDVLVHLAPR